MRRSSSRGNQHTALRVALAPVLIVALMVTMWAIAFELERQARQPSFSQVREAMLDERYEDALELINRYRPRSLAGEIDMRKARARCLIALEAHEKAIVQLRWLLVHDESNAIAYHNRLGELFSKLGDYDTAEVHYRHADELTHEPPLAPHPAD